MYDFRVSGTDARNTPNPGPNRSFRTGGPEIAAGSQSAANVAATSDEDLDGEINPHGANTTTYAFEYLSEAEYEASGGSFEGSEKPMSVPIPVTI